MPRHKWPDLRFSIWINVYQEATFDQPASQFGVNVPVELSVKLNKISRLKLMDKMKKSVVKPDFCTGTRSRNNVRFHHVEPKGLWAASSGATSLHHASASYAVVPTWAACVGRICHTERKPSERTTQLDWDNFDVGLLNALYCPFIPLCFQFYVRYSR